MKKRRLIILPALLIFILINACHSLKVNKEEKNEIIRLEKQDGPVQMVINFEKGKAFNHPSFVFWMEDLDGKYVETIYVTKSVATGLFRFGKPEKGEWVPSYKQYPAALPYWSHKKEAKPISEDIPSDTKNNWYDGITGATPESGFQIYTTSGQQNMQRFKIMFEINQTWDFNEYWTNNKYPDNKAYKTSCQPAIVYSAEVDLNNLQPEYELKPIGHSHYAGENGDLFEDLSTLTTALDIVKKISIKIN